MTSVFGQLFHLVLNLNYIRIVCVFFEIVTSVGRWGQRVCTAIKTISKLNVQLFCLELSFENLEKLNWRFSFETSFYGQMLSYLNCIRLADCAESQPQNIILEHYKVRKKLVFDGGYIVWILIWTLKFLTHNWFIMAFFFGTKICF